MEEKKHGDEKYPDLYDVLFKRIQPQNKVEEVKEILDVIEGAFLEESRLVSEEHKQTDELIRQSTNSDGSWRMDLQTRMLKLNELMEAQTKTWDAWYVRYKAKITILLSVYKIEPPVAKIILDFWQAVYSARDRYLHGHYVITGTTKPPT